jgi:hypothetical protein
LLFGRTPQRLSADFDSQESQNSAIGPVHVDLVTFNFFRETAESLLITSQVGHQIVAFIIGFPAVMVNESVPVYVTGPDFPAELDHSLTFFSRLGTQFDDVQILAVNLLHVGLWLQQIVRPA